VIKLGSFELRLRGEALEEGPVLVEEHGLRPVRGDRGVQRELVDVQRADHAEIVVPDQTHIRPAADLLGHLVRPRPVPDEVPEAPDLVRRIGVNRPEDGLERV
jgi:hypothetical protein